MIYSLRQLQELHKAGPIILPYGARLTPLAAEWLRDRRLTIGYVEPASADQSSASARPVAAAILWFSDGPGGAAKAALLAETRQANLPAAEVPAQVRSLVAAVKHCAAQIKAGNATLAVLLVPTGAAAMVYANRCPSLRAVLGTCLQAVDQAVNDMAANVLVLEYPYVSVLQTRNLIARFLRGGRQLDPRVAGDLVELSTCA